MKTSARGIEDLVLSEGLRLKAYKDSVGVWTIGVGHAATSGQPPIPKSGMTITRQEALDILARDLARFEDRVTKALGAVPQHVFDGAVSFDFNTGGIHRASWVTKYRAGDMAGARKSFLSWNKPPEIRTRRAREAALIFDGVYRSGGSTLASTDTKATIKVYQVRLAALGYQPGPIDGILGEKTKAAVELFQGDHGLLVNGIVDPATQDALDRAIDGRNAFDVVPSKWMPKCSMQRIITHWTAGAYDVTPVDREHYHLIIDGDGDLVRGDHEISDNVSTGDDDYAAHTKGTNTGSIGVAVCCMAGAIERPFTPGSWPMLKTQWEKMAAVVADLCIAYNIPVTPRTVLGHGEVQATLGHPQNGKWDPMALPWDPGMSHSGVGNLFRERVKAYMAAHGSPAAPPPPVAGPPPPPPPSPPAPVQPVRMGFWTWLRWLFGG